MAQQRARRPARPRLTNEVADLLRWERVARVATANASGLPHVVPVCHVLLGDRVYFGSGDKGRKVLNLRENPQLALTVDVYTEAWGQLRGVMVQGRARLVEGGPAFRRIRDRLYEKYAHYRTEAALAPSDSVSGHLGVMRPGRGVRSRCGPGRRRAAGRAASGTPRHARRRRPAPSAAAA